jgi:hypothetical protein
VGGKVVAIDAEMGIHGDIIGITQFAERTQRNVQVVGHAIAIHNSMHRAFLNEFTSNVMNHTGMNAVSDFSSMCCVLIRVGFPLKFSVARVVRKSESGNRWMSKVIQTENEGYSKEKSREYPGIFYFIQPIRF